MEFCCGDHYSAERRFVQGQVSAGRLWDVEIHVFVDRHRFEAFAVERSVEDSLLLRLSERRRRLVLNFSTSSGNPSSRRRRWPMGYSTVFFENRAVVQFHAQAFGDGPLFRIVVIGVKARLLDAFDLCAQRIDARIGWRPTSS